MLPHGVPMSWGGGEQRRAFGQAGYARLGQRILAIARCDLWARGFEINEEAGRAPTKGLDLGALRRLMDQGSACLVELCAQGS